MGTQDKKKTDKEVRLEKIAGLRDNLGVNPYPPEAYHPTSSLSKVQKDSLNLIKMEKELKLSGRITGLRQMGKVYFIDVRDDDAKLQFYISKKIADDLSWEILQYLDIGDFIGGEGILFETKRGETSLKVTRLTVLGKALRSPPLGKRSSDGEVHQSLSDTGRLLRDRHIALLTDDNLRKRILQRDQIIRSIRKYFYDEGFVEVETPILSIAYGGAAAKPFVTKSDALKQDFYLRVSPECSLKRVLAGGISKIFEIGKNFRNEGIDHSHNPEFTAIEWYEANSDYYHQMERFENLVAGIVRNLNDSYFVHFKDKVLDFEPPWPRLKVVEAVSEKLNIKADELTIPVMKKHCDKLGLKGYDSDNASWGELLMALFEEIVEPDLWGPVFVIDHPVEISPLTKRHRNDDRLVERFEPFAAYMEIGNAYSELNDPVEQRSRLEEQDLVREDPYGVDEYFLRAVEDGMPQAGGTGMGIDRIIMILTDARRLSDIMLFPAG